ncbi:MAG: tRNA uridine(34) 5-carboxymethylaminomethyl modification radical SAM/GNAT enzyme Elp3 [Thermoplasmatales archaeon]|nr:tRNA uridine(34) 5-carboxymethylaminomethyl modification radical SAM/GNAT enzyme Elp3 [Thermoplasmatales archaeon]
MISQSHIHKIFAERLSEEIRKGNIKNKDDLLKIKKRIAKELGINVPQNSEILPFVKDEKIKEILIRKPVRTISGVAIVAVMASPFHCPHGRCLPCPGNPPESAQSYTGYEPASLRARRNDYDPYLQVKDRLRQFSCIGHPSDKIELIVMGGTFPARDFLYQEWFIKRCYDAMNEINSTSLEEAKKINEKAKHRCVGLTIETRPDWCRLQHVEKMLEFGTTRVELGVQILDDKILYEINRGHTVKDVMDATRILKNAGFKVCYHIMPGLPSSNRENDIECFRKIFIDERFRPDMLKIYPTLVVKPSKLYEKWERGEYKAIREEEAIDIISEMKKYVPEWVRIQRIERDIPSYLVEDGVKKSNLRELVQQRLQEEGARCRCIRCREIRDRKVDDFELRRRDYIASDGREIFLSIENGEMDLIIAYCRLRIANNFAIVRELKVHGSMVEIGKRNDEKWQHKGFGKILIDKAEEIASKSKKERIFVLSGVGAKEYYSKLGYSDDGFYMSKNLCE